MNRLFINKIVSNGLFINIKKKSILIVDKFKKIVQGAVKFDFISNLDVVKNAILLLRGKAQSNEKVESRSETHNLFRNETVNNYIVKIESNLKVLFRSKAISTTLEKANTFAHKLFRNETSSSSDIYTRSSISVLLRNTINSNSQLRTKVLERKLFRSLTNERNNSKMLIRDTLAVSLQAICNSVGHFSSSVTNTVSRYDKMPLSLLNKRSLKSLDSIYPMLGTRSETTINMRTHDVANGELTVREIN